MDDRDDELTERLRAYHPPPPVPSEALWRSIADADARSISLADDLAAPAPQRRPWRLIAASLAFFALGTAVGFAAGARTDGEPPSVATAPEILQVAWF